MIDGYEYDGRIEPSHNDGNFDVLDLLMNSPNGSSGDKSSVAHEVEFLIFTDLLTVQKAPQKVPNGDKTDPAIGALKISSKPEERAAYQLLTELENNGGYWDAQNAEMLKGMLKDPSKKDLAVLILTKLNDPAYLHQTLNVLSGPDGEKLCEQFSKLLADPRSNDTALRILEVGSRTSSIKELLALASDTEHPFRKKVALDLLKENNPDSPLVAVKLASMYASGDKNQVTDANEFLKLIVAKETKQLACDILTKFSDPEHIHTVLQVALDHEPAAKRLMEMADEPFGAPRVNRLLELLHSKDSDGNTILDMLKSTDKRDHSDAKFLLDIPDIQVRSAFLRALANSDTSIGAHKLIESLENAKPRDREKYANVLQSLGAPNLEAQAREILVLLGKDAKSVELAEKAMTLDPVAQVELLNIFRSEESAKLNSDLLKLGTNDLSVILHVVKAHPNEGDALLRHLRDGEQRDPILKAVSNLGDPKQVAKLVEHLSDKETERGARELLRLLSSKDNYEVSAGRSLMDMYGNSESPDVTRIFNNGNSPKNATRILALLADPKLKETAVQMLHVENVVQRVKLLNALETPQGRQMLEVLKGVKGHVSIAAILAERFEGKPLMALKCAELIADPANVDPKNPDRNLFLVGPFSEEVTTALVPMLMNPDTVQVGNDFVRRLRDYRTQFDAYDVLKLNLPGKESEHMYNLSRDKTTREIYDLIAGVAASNFPDGARALLQVLTRGEDKSLNQMTPEARDKALRQQKEQKIHAEILLKMLSNPEEQTVAINALKSCNNFAELERVVKALNNPAEREGMKDLLSVTAKIAGSDVATERPPARDLLSRLANEKSANGPAHRFLALLNLPETRESAKKVIRCAQSSLEIEAFVRMIQPEDKSETSRENVDAILALGNSEKPEDRKAFQNLLQLATLAQGMEVAVAGPERTGRGEVPQLQMDAEFAYKKLMMMLTNPQSKDKAVALLQNCSSGRSCGAYLTMFNSTDTALGIERTFRMLVSPDETERASAKAFLSLFIPSSRFDDNPVRVENVQAFVSLLGNPDT